jgi:hypothetical protein
MSDRRQAGDWRDGEVIEWTGVCGVPVHAGGDRCAGPLVPAVRVVIRDVEELLAERGVTVYR